MKVHASHRAKNWWMSDSNFWLKHFKAPSLTKMVSSTIDI